MTHWSEQLVVGDEGAARKVYERYWEHLLRTARKHLAEGARHAADEEDVALSAFASFCSGVAIGRFDQLGDRDDLWKLLVTITARKAMAQMRRQKRLKRDGGEVRGESVFFKRTN